MSAWFVSLLETLSSAPDAVKGAGQVVVAAPVALGPYTGNDALDLFLGQETTLATLTEAHTRRVRKEPRKLRVEMPNARADRGACKGK